MLRVTISRITARKDIARGVFMFVRPNPIVRACRSVCLASVTLTAVFALPVWAEDTAGADTGVFPASEGRGPRTLARKREPESVSMFRKKSGGTVLTNRVWKYRGLDDFEEVKLDLQPITKPKLGKYTIASGSIAAPGNIKALVHHYARLYGVNPNLIFAVIRAESGFNPNAKSPAGACGLMQLMPATAVLMNVTNIFDPAENIAGGTQYLAKMLRIFNGDKRLALAGYNAGPNAVKQYGGIPPYPETQEYVPRVIEYERRFGQVGYEKYRDVPMDRPTFAMVRPSNAPKKHPYIVYFHSGLTQPADNVNEKDPYYDIQVSSRTFRVRKDLVKKVEQVN